MTRASAKALRAMLVAMAVAGCGAPPPSGGPSGTSSPTPVISTATPAAASPAPSIAVVSPSSTASPTATPTAIVGFGRFALSSAAFSEGGAIPSRYTCDGADGSPPLHWSGLPVRTVAIALIVDDPDANGFVHWLAFDIDAGVTSLPAGVARDDPTMRQGRNGFGRIGWDGPCPPSGTHRYVVTLYALDRRLSLADGASSATIRASMAGHVVGTAALRATYRRGG